MIRRRGLDKPLLVSTLVLLTLGLLTLYSAGQTDVPSAASEIWKRQLVWLAIGTVAAATAFRVSPRMLEVTTAWSFNVYKVMVGSSSGSGSWTFELNGSPLGTDGDAAWFDGMVVVQDSENGSSFHALEMTSDIEGSLTLDLPTGDATVYFIVASMPGVFEDVNPEFQLFPYQVRISSELTRIGEDRSPTLPEETGRYNLYGQPVQKEDGGVQLIRYHDGQVRKVLEPK